MTKTPKTTRPASFEAAMKELDVIVEGMETGQLPLEESLLSYRRGAELVRYCRDVLEAARQEVRILEEDGLKPFVAEREASDAGN